MTALLTHVNRLIHPDCAVNDNNAGNVLVEGEGGDILLEQIVRQSVKILNGRLNFRGWEQMVGRARTGRRVLLLLLRWRQQELNPFSC